MAKWWLCSPTSNQMLGDSRFCHDFVPALSLLLAGLSKQKCQTKLPAVLRLASSIWLVCTKRAATARLAGTTASWEEMRQNIALRLRDFWDAGIRGPDFVWQLQDQQWKPIASIP